MEKYGKKAGEKLERATHERKRGTLKSSSGRRVTSRKQAIAIGLSEARDAGGKVPKKKGSAKRSRKATTQILLGTVLVHIRVSKRILG